MMKLLALAGLVALTGCVVPTNSWAQLVAPAPAPPMPTVVLPAPLDMRPTRMWMPPAYPQQCTQTCVPYGYGSRCTMSCY